MVVALDTYEVDPALLLDVLATLHRQAMGQVEVTPSGCVLHPTGRIRWLGASFVVKRVLFEYRNGAMPDGHVLVRICPTDDCVRADHQVAQSRQQFGQWLGTGRRSRLPTSA